jgi:hypothetical protein
MRTKTRAKKGTKAKKGNIRMYEARGSGSAWKSFWNRYCNL